MHKALEGDRASRLDLSNDVSGWAPCEPHLVRKDLQALQLRAMEEDIPYQTLMGSILHKYAAGRLAERDT
jgi:hypothetical protein